MATVKGDVHDIGKNIVGVVLQCNNYEVIDLGVMVPAQKILDKAEEVDADLIGLSGLITPSLDEMVNFATEMERQGFEIPLLIGGATTSRAHTAVKVDPALQRPGGLGEGRLALGAGGGGPALPDAAPREAAGRHRGRLRLAAGAARRQARPADGLRSRTPAPTGPRSTGRPTTPPRAGHAARGTRVFEDYDLAELRDYIDWQPFFNAWEMKGKFPDILNNPTTGEAARRLYDDAQEMLDQIDRGEVADRATASSASSRPTRWRRHRGLHRRVAQRGADRAAQPAPAGRAPRGRAQPVARRLRRAEGDRAAPTTSAPSRSPPASASQDRITEFKEELDDYCAILLESLADRLAEAFAERLHQRVRTELWGYAARRAPRQRGPDRREVRRHPARPRLPGLPRPHREADALGAARRRGEHRHRAHREHGDVARAPRSAAGTSPTRSRSTSWSAGSAATRWRTTPSARAGRLAEAERWLSPNLGYDPDD